MRSTGLYVTSGVILKRIKVGEADRILTVFTKEYGKIRVIAKGVRRIYSRRSPHVELFRNVRLSLNRGKTMDSVSEAEGMDDVTGNTTIRGIGHAYFVCELVDRLLPESLEHRDVYALLVDMLRNIRTADSQYDLAAETDKFALVLLRILGYLPKEKELPHDEIVRFIEEIIERKLKSPAILTRLDRQE